MPYDEAIPGFLIALACGTILGLAVLMLVYKMIDGDLHWGPGFCAIVLVFPTMFLAIHPSHPVIPGVVLVVAIALMVMFPFAEHTLEQVELRGIQAGQLAKSYAAVEARSDNFAARFELAKRLHDYGFNAAAIAMASSTLASLSSERDDIRNQSLRDIFVKEEIALKKWQAETIDSGSLKCANCGTPNSRDVAFCVTCGQPYLLHLMQLRDVKPRVWARLVTAFALIALFIPGGAALAMAFDGVLRIVSFILALGLVGGLLAWLFRPPRLPR